jgi:hypothetical protein
MSLDIFLRVNRKTPKVLDSGIFIREDGQTKEISREEWDRRYPGREPIIVMPPSENAATYSGNITHNLRIMADAADLYECLWRPDEIGITLAIQLIQPLKDGLARLQSDPETYRALNPVNGWGSYEGLVDFVAEYLAACIAFPEAEVFVSR